VGARHLHARLPARDPDLADRRPVLSGSPRPLYHELAWAYDALVAPAGIGAAFVAATLAARGVQPGALVVDAGCGTGAHSRALAARGYRVIGIDASAELIAQARRESPSLELVVADLRDWRPAEPAAAVLCRGVLNDLLTEREAALRALGEMLAPGGVLVADVRDWERSAARYAGGRGAESRARTERGGAARAGRGRADRGRGRRAPPRAADEAVDAGRAARRTAGRRLRVGGPARPARGGSAGGPDRRGRAGQRERSRLIASNA
jgi:SAM-dependent methyltransferase